MAASSSSSPSRDAAVSPCYCRWTAGCRRRRPRPVQGKPAELFHKASQAMKPVWIIDDDRSIRWVFEKTLARENIAFKTFSSAQEALAELDTDTPQGVVSDIRMPGDSGLELLQKA